MVFTTHADDAAWDGYCCQVAAAAASKARETQTIQPVVYDEMPDFYKA